MNILKSKVNLKKVALYSYGSLIGYNVYKNIDENITKLHKYYKQNKTDNEITIMDYNIEVVSGIYTGIIFGFFTPITYTYKTIKYLENIINNK